MGVERWEDREENDEERKRKTRGEERIENAVIIMLANHRRQNTRCV